MLTTNVLDDARILVIDDDEDDILLVKDLFNDHSPQTEIVSQMSFQDGLRQLNKGIFDLCLVDYHLGAKTGLDFIEEAKKLGCKTPIILLTGQGNYDIDLKGMNAGAADYIKKSELNFTSLEKSMRYAITHAKALEELRINKKLLYETAFYDPLTQLPNRALFINRLDHAYQVWQRSKNQLAIIFIDLDGFKTISNSLGHDVGNEILKSIAERLQQFMRNADTVAHLSVDEFAVLIESVDSRRNVLRFANQISNLIQESFYLKDHTPIDLTASIGIAFSSDLHNTYADLLRSANIAMYRVKKAGGNSIAVFDATMHTELSEQLKLEQDLKHALASEEFELFYQPIVSIKNHNIFSFEALLRWRKNRKLITPRQFLKEADEAGLLAPISDWVLQKACFWAKAQNQRDNVSININIAQKQFDQKNFVETVHQALKKSGLNANKLHLEITEEIMIKDAEHALRKLRQLKMLGVNINLDNFGAGYASLKQILHYPIDVINVDPLFSKNLPNRKSEAIFSAIIFMAKNLGIKVIAKGIENTGQLEYLKKVDCDFAQGYLFAYPLPGNVSASLVGKELLPQIKQESLITKDHDRLVRQNETAKVIIMPRNQ